MWRLDASKITTDVPSQSFRFSIMLAVCRQPQLFIFPVCSRVSPTMVSLPQSHRQRHTVPPLLPRFSVGSRQTSFPNLRPVRSFMPDFILPQSGKLIYALAVMQDACAFLKRSVFDRRIHDCGKRHINRIGILVTGSDGEARLRLLFDKFAVCDERRLCTGMKKPPIRKIDRRRKKSSYSCSGIKQPRGFRNENFSATI